MGKPDCATCEFFDNDPVAFSRRKTACTKRVMVWLYTSNKACYAPVRQGKCTAGYKRRTSRRLPRLEDFA
jgi:hypothetical protein